MDIGTVTEVEGTKVHKDELDAIVLARNNKCWERETEEYIKLTYIDGHLPPTYLKVVKCNST
jgi:hypothetical protein